MRLIDADELYALIDGGFDLNFDEVPETKAELLRMIAEQPVIEEREKGKWIDAQYPFSKCNICECYFDTVNNLANFCPKCGADMR